MAEFGLALQGRISSQALAVSPSQPVAAYAWPASGAGLAVGRSAGDVPSVPASWSRAGTLGVADGGTRPFVYCDSCNQPNDVAAAYCSACGLRLGVTPAGFWIRTGAYVVDSIVLYIADKILSPLVGGLAGPSTTWSTVDTNGYVQVVQTSNTGAVLFGFAFTFLVSLLYFSLFWARAGRTPGMRVFGLQVRDVSGDLMSWWQAAGRYVMLFVGILCVFLGVISVAWQKDKRGWHDLASGTEVIRLKS